MTARRIGQMSVRFIVYGEARPAGSKTAGVSKQGKVFVRDASAGAREWKKAVAKEAAEAMGDRPLLDGALWVSLEFVQPRPKSHFGARGLLPSAPPYPTVRPDLLKLARAVEDALTGIVYRDDAQIVSEVLMKSYGDRACVEIQVSDG